jgi:hypothetical protein
MMGIYLSHLRNRAQYVSGGVTISPDENYAREIMQLFSIGLVLRHPDGSLVLDTNGLPIPTYDNTDIGEVARVLTGFCHGARHNSVQVQRFNGLTLNAPGGSRVGPSIEIQGVNFFNFGEGGGDRWYQAPWIYPMKVLGRVGSTVYHDFGQKTLLTGKVGETVLPAQTLPGGDTTAVRQQTNTMAETDIRMLHNMLAGDPAAGSYNGHPNTAVNISRWLIQRFTTSNPSAGYLYRVSQTYRDTNGNLGAVLKAILLDYEARSLQLADSSISHGRMKEPLVHFLSIMRGSKARSGLPLTALRDMKTGFSQTDSMSLNGWPGGLSQTLTQAELDAYEPDATRFRFPDYTNVIGQSPLRAPSVFNWFLPDYVVPGAMAEAGLFAPEFQIASEINLVTRINRLWTFTWMNMDGMAAQPGVDVDDIQTSVGSAAVQVKVGAVNTQASSFTTSRSYTFTPANWNTPQTVHVAAVDDNRREGPHTTSISHLVSSSDANYNNKPMPAVTVNINDNEGPVGQVIVEESDGITLVAEDTNENLFSDTYTVRLGSAPTSSVSVTCSANAHLKLEPSSLSFDSSNWSAPQTVTVKAVNDSYGSELIHMGFISHAVTSADPAFDGTPAPSFVAFIGDNNGASGNGINIRHTGANTRVVEGGSSDRFVVALNRRPSGNVTVNVSSHSRVTRAPASLTFTTGNWWVPQVVTVAAVDDALANGDQTFNLALTSSGGGYSSSANVSVTVIDNEPASSGGLVITESGGHTTVNEGSPYSSGNTDSYTIRLSSAPTANVTVTVFPERHPSPMSHHAKLMGYFMGDATSNTSNAQKDRIVFDYQDKIDLYRSVFIANGGVGNDVTANLSRHLAAVIAVVDQFDMMWCGGQLKAQWPSLTQADINNVNVVNPRKSIVVGTLYSYSTNRGTNSGSFFTESRRRVQIAAYLISLSPQSMILK